MWSRPSNLVLASLGVLLASAADAPGQFNVYYRANPTNPWVFYSRAATREAGRTIAEELRADGHRAEVRAADGGGEVSGGTSYIAGSNGYWSSGTGGSTFVHRDHWGGGGSHWNSWSAHHHFIDHHHDVGPKPPHPTPPHHHPHPTPPPLHHHVHHTREHHAAHHVTHHATHHVHRHVVHHVHHHASHHRR